MSMNLHIIDGKWLRRTLDAVELDFHESVRQLRNRRQLPAKLRVLADFSDVVLDTKRCPRLWLAKGLNTEVDTAKRAVAHAEVLTWYQQRGLRGIRNALSHYQQCCAVWTMVDSCLRFLGRAENVRKKCFLLRDTDYLIRNLAPELLDFFRRSARREPLNRNRLVVLISLAKVHIIGRQGARDLWPLCETYRFLYASDMLPSSAPAPCEFPWSAHPTRWIGPSWLPTAAN